MKLYVTFWQDADLGQQKIYTSSKEQAWKELKNVREQHKAKGLSSKPDGYDLIDVPTTRKELIEWLNKNASGDK